MIEVRTITVTVLVDRDTEDRPEKWDWSELTDTWAVPAPESELVATFETRDDFYDSLDSGTVAL